MRLNFRQGIVRHQTDTFGSPTFLSSSGGYVSLVVSPDPTLVTFIHGTKDYLYTEARSVSNAWGPFAVGPDDFWLYWELDRVTGNRTFGSTTLEPVETPTVPNSPATGQMWFSTINNVWYEYNGAGWVEVIRVFACRLENGTTARSMSMNAPDFRGTQVGLTVNTRVGSLTFDQSGKPIKTGDSKFFTTEDIFVTGVPTGASLRVNNILIPGIAQQPLASFMVVEYMDYNRLVPASPYTQGTKLYGMVEEDAIVGEVINFVTEGMIYNPNWDWIGDGADVNTPVYIDTTGQVTLTPAIPEQLPVGVVTGPQEILFSPRLFPQVTANVSNPVTFVELTDTPTNYTSAALQGVRVNAGGTGLEFAPLSGGGATSFPGLTDTPSNYTGAADQFVKVNAGATGLEFTAAPSGTTEFTGLTDTPADYTAAADQFVKVNTGGTGLEFATAPGGLPTSTQECSVLVADDAGGWVERSPLGMPEPYDIACHVLGEMPGDTTILRYVASRDFTILNYGNQAGDGRLVNLSSATNVGIEVNSSQIGIIQFSNVAIDARPVIYMDETDINTGDVIEIICGSATPAAELIDVMITLRGVILPISCAAPLTVSFNNASYFDKFVFDASDFTIVGNWTYAEWAVTEWSNDSGYTWTPLNGGFNRSGSDSDGVTMTFGATVVNFKSNSNVHRTTNLFPTSMNDIGSAGLDYRVQVTLYGPAGKATAVTEMSWY